MIDLHLHTTASDGCCSPEQLVIEAAAAGVTRLAVTDHDTVAATAPIARLCAARGLEPVSGIEVTAVERGRDVHVLGYFIDPADPQFLGFLSQQRSQRVARVEAIAARLATLGMPIDAADLLAAARSGGRSVGRPHVARAMVLAGHVRGLREAFDLWLEAGRPAFVPRTGASPDEVVRVIHGAGGVASLAHPGRTLIDSRIPELRDAGLDALEAYHSDHSPEDVARYLRMAAELELLITGGSDYHADPSRGVTLGSVSLPEAHWQRLLRHQAQGTRHRAQGKTHPVPGTI